MPDYEYPFFTHTECKYFFCREGIAPQEFNCLFCYCPLYAFGPGCGGVFTYTEKGVKNCLACSRPHKGDAGTLLVKEHFAQLAWLARQSREDA